MKARKTVDEAVQALGDAVDLYLDGGATPGHVASTVVAADLMGVMALRFFERE